MPLLLKTETFLFLHYENFKIDLIHFRMSISMVTSRHTEEKMILLLLMLALESCLKKTAI